MNNVDIVGKASLCVAEPDLLVPDRLRSRIESVTAVERNLLPIEEVSRGHLEDERKGLLKQLRLCEIQERLHEHSKGGYKLLRQAPFKWRSAAGWPLLAPFSINSPLCRFRVELRRVRGEQLIRRREISPGLPIVLSRHYGYVLDRLEEFAREKLQHETILRGARLEEVNVRIDLATHFAGLIPGWVKTEIRRALDTHMFSHMFVVAEVEEWQVGSVVTSRQGDPLVVGVDHAEQLWLIAKFDTTTLEEEVAERHAHEHDSVLN